MLNATRPRRPSLTTAQPADSNPTASFRYSTSRPRFSTNPSRRTSGSQESSRPPQSGARGMSVDEPQKGWTEGQYPGPPLPARPGAGLMQLPPTPADTSASGHGSAKTTGGTRSSSNTGREAAISHATTSTDRAAPMDVDTSGRTSSSRTNRRPLPPRPHPPAVSELAFRIDQKKCLIASVRFIYHRWIKYLHGSPMSRLTFPQTSRSIRVRRLTHNKATHLPYCEPPLTLDKTLKEIE